jgi:hypothetical protein
MKILAIDPGEMTGYCYGDIDKEKLRYTPFQAVDDVDDLWQRLNRFDPKFIVIEDFEFRKRARGGLNLFPVQFIGVARLWGQLNECRVFLQKAAQGKSYYTNEVLKKHGLYLRGMEHGMDASRHLLQWTTFGYGYQFMGKKTTKEFVELIGLSNWDEGGDKVNN